MKALKDVSKGSILTTRGVVRTYSPSTTCFYLCQASALSNIYSSVTFVILKTLIV